MENVFGKIKETLEIWNKYGANLKYKLVEKNNYIHIDGVVLCKTTNVVDVYPNYDDAVFIELKNNMCIVIVIHWVDFEDAYICQIYKHDMNDEYEENDVMLFDII